MPWPQVRAFEQMWSMQALTLDAATAQPKYESSSRAMQYLKVGAAAVGGGALLAVTGGLAAPAIAAGLGAAVSLAHGKMTHALLSLHMYMLLSLVSHTGSLRLSSVTSGDELA